MPAESASQPPHHLDRPRSPSIAPAPRHPWCGRRLDHLDSPAWQSCALSRYCLPHGRPPLRNGRLWTAKGGPHDVQRRHARDVLLLSELSVLRVSIGRLATTLCARRCAHARRYRATHR